MDVVLIFLIEVCMELATVQLGQWRKAKAAGYELIDSTVRSGDKELAPTWDIVMGVKSGTITEEEYTQKYKALMRDSYNNNRTYWETLLDKPRIAVACYCGAGAFCHRKILAELLEGICKNKNIPFIFKGELK